VLKTEQARKHAKIHSEADARLRAFLHKLFAEAPRSKQQIAEALEAQLGERVSLARLDSFTAPKKKSARFPAYMLTALCEALGDDSILLFLARPRIRNEFEFAGQVRELRRICDELLAAELPAKHGRNSSGGNGSPCAR
jgi:hypothetical protein